MRLNEYPKEELEDLLCTLAAWCAIDHDDECVNIWIDRIKQAISDRELEDKELPFKKPENEHN